MLAWLGDLNARERRKRPILMVFEDAHWTDGTHLAAIAGPIIWQVLSGCMTECLIGPSSVAKAMDR
jgi:hypothetical protein